MTAAPSVSLMRSKPGPRSKVGFGHGGLPRGGPFVKLDAELNDANGTILSLPVAFS